MKHRPSRVPAVPNYLEARQLEEIDLLRLKVANSSVADAARARDQVMIAILEKYTGDAKGRISITPDGAIIRPRPP